MIYNLHWIYYVLGFKLCRPTETFLFTDIQIFPQPLGTGRKELSTGAGFCVFMDMRVSAVSALIGRAPIFFSYFFIKIHSSDFLGVLAPARSFMLEHDGAEPLQC